MDRYIQSLQVIWTSTPTTKNPPSPYTILKPLSITVSFNVDQPTRKKHCSFLIGACYQQNSIPAEKEIWIGKMNHLLSHMTTTWTFTVILTGDMSINTNIPAKYLKICIDEIQSLICHIINSKNHSHSHSDNISRSMESVSDKSDFENQESQGIELLSTDRNLA